MTARHIDLAEFRQLGFLQEANRQFFHPHGLALEMTFEDDGSVRLSGVWDYRGDPEGIIFADPPDPVKRDRVADERERHREARLRLMGEVVQPMDFPR